MRLLAAIGKAHETGEAGHVLARENQLVLCPGRIVGITAMPVRQRCRACATPVPIQDGGNSEPEQHALHALETRRIRLRQANADALALSALNGAIAVEQAPQKSAMTLAGTALQDRKSTR